jgi:hypothetical protein
MLSRALRRKETFTGWLLGLLRISERLAMLCWVSSVEIWDERSYIISQKMGRP